MAKGTWLTKSNRFYHFITWWISACRFLWNGSLTLLALGGCSLWFIFLWQQLIRSKIWAILANMWQGDIYGAVRFTAKIGDRLQGGLHTIKAWLIHERFKLSSWDAITVCRSSISMRSLNFLQMLLMAVLSSSHFLSDEHTFWLVPCP